MLRRLLRVLIAGAIVGFWSIACGRSDILSEEEGETPSTPGSASCGDGKCVAPETCASCSVDCGFCPGCGDGTCAAGESCRDCPQDCGVCRECGDGFCQGGETCLTCAPDCGKCAGCGDGKCDASKESCFTCPEDCGKCKECGNGVCSSPETCASCIEDCGVCAVCGNKKCEGPYETCANCSEDCGECETIGCFAMLTCGLGCVDLRQSPPAIRVSCIGDCVAVGCPSARFLFDQAFNCFIAHLEDCGTNMSCLMRACDATTGACLGSSCN